jgi:hypothetical protein
VVEMMHHLNTALNTSEGECTPASYDLGVAYRDLGEYVDAVERFVHMLDTPSPTF